MVVYLHYHASLVASLEAQHLVRIKPCRAFKIVHLEGVRSSMKVPLPLTLLLPTLWEEVRTEHCSIELSRVHREGEQGQGGMKVSLPLTLYETDIV